MVLPLFTSSSKLSRSFRAIVIALVAILAVEIGAQVVLPESLMVHYFHLMRARVCEVRDVSVQVMGDSVARTALWAGLLEEELAGTRFENYALGGSGPVFSYFLLRDQIKAGNKPEYVLYAHSPHTYSGVSPPVLIGTFCTWREVCEVSVSGRIFNDCVFGTLNRLLYSLRYRSEIKKALSGDISFFTDKRDPVIGQDLYEYESANVRRHDFSKPLSRVVTDPFCVTDLNRVYVDKFLALAEENDITVLFVTLPLPQKALDARTESGFASDYYAFVDSIAERGVVVLQKEFLVLPNEDFRDYSHVNVHGGVKFTQLMAEKLRPVIGQQRAHASK